MNQELDQWMEHPYVETLAFFSVAVLALIVFLAIFELVTKYNGWDEIKKGNVAVAMAISGKIFGICNIFRFAILTGEDVYHSLLWAGFGFILLLLAYLVFEFMTPYFNIDAEIAKDNRAVGLISMFISVSLSYIVGAGIS